LLSTSSLIFDCSSGFSQSTKKISTVDYSIILITIAMNLKPNIKPNMISNIL